MANKSVWREDALIWYRPRVVYHRVYFTIRRLQRLVVYRQTTNVSAAHATLPHTVPRVDRSYENFQDGFELRLLPCEDSCGCVAGAGPDDEVDSEQ